MLNPSLMPTIPFGRYHLSRLIMGSNPINGGSHLSRMVNAQMKRFYTQEQVQATLARCQEAGINAWQATPANVGQQREHRQRGGTLHFLSLARESPDDPQVLARLAEVGAIAVAHHGEVTDSLWRAGEIGQAREFCKRIRDAGMMVGVSTHIPQIVDEVESQGWDVDFYMCCVYERHRTREELKALLGRVPLPLKEVYLEEDPPRMLAAMRATDKPCLAFKILAAGRLCDRPEWVEAAFASTLRQIKRNDGVIVGMYPEYEDQIAINAEYVRRHGVA